MCRAVKFCIYLRKQDVMGRPKKPDPPTQRLSAVLDSEAVFLLEQGAEMEHERVQSRKYANDEITSKEFHATYEFSHLSKPEQRRLRDEWLNEIIKRDYRNIFGNDGYDIAMKNYREQQEKGKKHWGMDNE